MNIVLTKAEGEVPMPSLLNRETGAVHPGERTMCAEHFQMAYVTNNPDQACTLLTRQLGIRAFSALDGINAEGGRMDVRFAWRGTLMYEIIHASGPGSAIFMHQIEGLPDFALHHHHLGFLVQDRAHWESVLDDAQKNGCEIPWKSSNTLVDACFVKRPGFPHLFEYLLPTVAGLAFFNNVPRS
ncbi:MAG: hypothetical protein KGQ42_04300 [Alphaproteobacteria bacterium]|nr:hypothetical protein [Alphaproteobacteria bacterium]MDE2043306.1 hypothetical protein [Alphaproteobacteria bacterium]MDE2340014.1 hypothetical protein [Alphaproteobacteria bacterium]